MEFRSLGENRILSALLPEHRERLRPSLQLVTLSFNEVIHEPGVRLNHVYFPLTSIIAFVYSAQDGSSAVMGLAGNDGLIGVDLFLGGEAAFHRAVVLVDGYAVTVSADALRDEFVKGGPLQSLLLRYIRTLMIQISQSAVCNRFHALEKRLCRWLLFLHDRVGSGDLCMTQEALATVVGARRETVSAAVRQLRDLGLILHTKGRITILERSNLEARACECYQVVETEVDRLLGAQGKQTGGSFPAQHDVRL
jgi:CRP-like cAMP-binding protein